MTAVNRKKVALSCWSPLTVRECDAGGFICLVSQVIIIVSDSGFCNSVACHTRTTFICHKAFGVVRQKHYNCGFSQTFKRLKFCIQTHTLQMYVIHVMSFVFF